jgi:hypothetical protein
MKAINIDQNYPLLTLLCLINNILDNDFYFIFLESILSCIQSGGGP